MNLTDDAIEHILPYLQFQDQLALCGVSNRLSMLLRLYWQRSCAAVKLTEINWDDAANDRLVLFYIHSIKEKATQLQLAPISPKRLELFGDVVFPKVETLSMVIASTNSRRVNEYMKCVVNSFPKLTKLHLQAPITGHLLWELTNLEELNLEGCLFLCGRHLRRILTALKKLKKLALTYSGQNLVMSNYLNGIACCGNLEVLHLNDYNMETHAWNALVRLPKLRKIICTTCEYYKVRMIRKFVDSYMESVHSFISDASVGENDFIVDDLCRLTNLRVLALSHDVLTGEQWQKLGRHLPNLEELRYTQGTPGNDQGLLSMVASCPELKVLDISETPVREEFLGELLVLGQNRRPTLEMRCFGTLIAREFVDMDDLKVVHDKVDEHPVPRSFSFEWVPTIPNFNEN